MTFAVLQSNTSARYNSMVVHNIVCTYNFMHINSCCLLYVFIIEDWVTFDSSLGYPFIYSRASYIIYQTR